MNEQSQNTGDDEFIRLYLAHECRIREYILCLVKPYAYVDDILQNVVVLMRKQYSSLESHDHFLRWALSIVRFEVLKHFEKKRNRLQMFSSELISAVEEKVADIRLKDPQQGAYRSFSIANGANGENWPGTHVPARRYSEIRNPASKYLFIEDLDPRGSNVGSWQMNFGPPRFIDPVAMWHKEQTTLGFADGHSNIHRWVDPTFIEWCEGGMYNPTAFSFDLTPPDDEQTDITFLAGGFPCRSHY